MNYDQTFLEDMITDIKELNLPEDLEERVIKRISNEIETTGLISNETFSQLIITAQEESMIPYTVVPDQFKVDTIQQLTEDEAKQLSKLFSSLVDKQLKYQQLKNTALEKKITALANYTKKQALINKKDNLVFTAKSIAEQVKTVNVLIENENSKFFKRKAIIYDLEERKESLMAQYKETRERLTTIEQEINTSIETTAKARTKAIDTKS